MDFQFSFKTTAFYAVAAIAASSCSSRTIDEKKTEAKADAPVISALIPSATSIRLEERGDLDLDGDEDVLLVLKVTTGSEPQFKSRTLVVLRRDANGQLENILENPKAILCQRCGASMLEDSLKGIHIDGGGFSLQFEGLSRVMWSREYRFEYSKHARTWQLREIKGGVTDRINGNSCITQLGPSEFGSISLAQFDPNEFPGCSIP